MRHIAEGRDHLLSRPVEVLIAESTLVSAVHAYRPIFPGEEAWIAVFFGLIHGLAFAATLGRLGLGRWDRVDGILVFNLGIETMQMLVVAAASPSLMLMSRTTARQFQALASFRRTRYRQSRFTRHRNGTRETNPFLTHT